MKKLLTKKIPKDKYSITFACLNSSDYTKQCIQSLIQHDISLDRLVVIDNASTDNTKEVLESFFIKNVIYNKKNLSCGCAWNQGILYFQSEWTIVMNNDILLTKNFIEDLINSAEENDLKVVSPAMIEGPLSYNLEEISTSLKNRMNGYIRLNDKHAVCMAIHHSVWEEIGYFACNPKLLGFEDTLFFDALEKNNIKTGITSSTWIHHFGSITLNKMKRDNGISQKDSLSDRKNYRLLNNNWISRKVKKLRRKILLNKSIKNEISKFKATVRGFSCSNRIKWMS